MNIPFAFCHRFVILKCDNQKRAIIVKSTNSNKEFAKQTYEKNLERSGRPRELIAGSALVPLERNTIA